MTEAVQREMRCIAGAIRDLCDVLLGGMNELGRYVHTEFRAHFCAPKPGCAHFYLGEGGSAQPKTRACGQKKWAEKMGKKGPKTGKNGVFRPFFGGFRAF